MKMSDDVVNYRVLHEMPEFIQVGELAVNVWGFAPREIVPPGLMHVLALNGGMVMGAYDGEEIIGLSLCLPVWRGEERFLWSHWTAVHRNYQRQGIGLELKRQQRLWALANGYHLIRWTYDPLQQGNAHFNFGLLTDIAALYSDTYHINFYGDMNDQLNQGLPSDRLEVTWQLDAPPLDSAALPPAEPLLRAAGDAPHVSRDIIGQVPSLAVQVPVSLATLRNISTDLAFEWRLAQRDALRTAFTAGYRVVYLRRDGNATHYILHAGPHSMHSPD